MKNKTFFAIILCMATAYMPSFAETTITVDSVRQRWPWNNKVDVTYTIAGDDATATKVCKLLLTTTINGNTYSVYNPGLNVNVKPGTYTITWDDAPAGVICDTCTIKAELYTSPAVPVGDDYMIIDLATGEVSYEGVFPASASLCGASGQKLSNARYNVDKYKSTHYVLRKVPKGTYKTGDSVAYPTGNQLNNDATWTTDKVYYMGVFPWTNYQYWYVFDLYDPAARSAEQQDLKARPLGFVRDIRGISDPMTAPPQEAIKNKWNVIKWLNGKTHMNFDLPTELMYEIAARAGTTTKYFWGDDANDAPKYAVYGRSGTRPSLGWEYVGTKLPNNWGLYDMEGLDWEWCLDSYVAGEDPSTHTDVFTPFYDANATLARVRGCDAKGAAANMNPAYRSGADFRDRGSSTTLYTFRVAYIVPDSGE